MEVNKLTGIILDSCIRIHSKIGPGCFEKVYEETLYYELNKSGIEVKRQLLMPIEYKELFIKDAYRIDLLVENKLVLEIKSVERLTPVHFKQVRTYLRLLNLKNGLLLNFNVDWMKDGFNRVFNNEGE
ncbi:MAG TPA: GxxExxY protein [Flavisolibacter sp.]|nr:GxxExxY protein [Flavisolibacter sp.]